MNNRNLIKLLKKSVSRSGGTRIHRLGRCPGKIFRSKSLEFLSLWSKHLVRVKAKTFWNEEMFVVIPEEVSSNIYRHGFFEEGLTEMVLMYLAPNMIFFDIGAHFGYFSLLGSAIVGNNGHVYSFEPAPSTFEMLKSNTKKRDKIHIDNRAVFSKETTILFNDYGIRFSSHNSAYQARLEEKLRTKLKVKKYEVKTITLDEYIDYYKIVPDFIKIDAESAEYEILRGMENILNKVRPIITLEVGDMDIENVVTSRELILYLMDRGYQPYECKGGKVVKHNLKDRYNDNNILFLPK